MLEWVRQGRMLNNKLLRMPFIAWQVNYDVVNSYHIVTLKILLRAMVVVSFLGSDIPWGVAHCFMLFHLGVFTRF